MKISVLIPTYNGASCILETIQSILHQDFDNFEVIINDDCSTDNTIDTVKSLKDPKIMIYKNKHNLGYPGNLEAGR
ncbi:MAG TPA: glycosyltransferase, partial [Patescibacteria group bacterium]